MVAKKILLIDGHNVIHRVPELRPNLEGPGEQADEDTLLRYKGLERRMVIVGDVMTDALRYPFRMSIAASHAFGALKVVASKSEIGKDPFLGNVVEMGADEM